MEKSRTSLQNRYSELDEEGDLSIQEIDDNLTSIITECTIAVGGKIVRRDTGKLSQETKVLITKRQSMKVSNTTDRMARADLSMLINKRKVADIRKFNTKRIQRAVKKGGSLKTVNRKLGIGEK